jgi:protein-disulfide isomerase/uncharacterized membrane protein
MRRGRFVDDNVPPLRWPWWLSVVLCAVGLTLSILLERIHIKIHSDPAFHSFCSIDRTVNCDIVARSAYAVFLGVPLAVWGIFGYLVAGFVAVWGARRREPRLAAGCALYLASAFTLTSIGLGAISALLVSAVCILCIATYGVNVLLLLGAIVAARDSGLRSSLAEPWRALRSRRGVRSLVILVACAALLVVAYPSYWKPAQSTERPKPTEPNVPHGIEPGGGHFIGAEKPVVTLLEYSDYECPYCRQAHSQLRALIERYPTLLRLVHRHYPLDMSCNSSLTAKMHQNACFAAMIAECAGEQDRFWQANDYLFAEARSLGSRSNAEIARDLGLDQKKLEACLRSDGPRAVAADVDEGNRLNIQGTPTFFVEGQTYTGTFPPWLVGRLERAAAAADASSKSDAAR